MKMETKNTAEQQARDMLDRMGFDGAGRTAGDVVELANLIDEVDRISMRRSIWRDAITGEEKHEELDKLCDTIRAAVRDATKYRFIHGEGAMTIAPRRGRPITQPTPDQIKAAREAAGLTQTEAANLAWVKLRTWQDWEYAKTPIQLGLWELFLIKIGRRRGR
jgi:DNA (cytosine-5)-methyltransferase 1